MFLVLVALNKSVITLGQTRIFYCILKFERYVRQLLVRGQRAIRGWICDVCVAAKKLGSPCLGTYKIFGWSKLLFKCWILGWLQNKFFLCHNPAPVPTLLYSSDYIIYNFHFTWETFWGKIARQTKFPSR